MDDETIKKREGRIKAYALIGVLIISIISAFSNHPEFLCAILGLLLVLFIRFLIFNTTSYTSNYSKYRRGENPKFIYIQLLVVLGYLAILLLFIFVYYRVYSYIIN